MREAPALALACAALAVATAFPASAQQKSSPRQEATAPAPQAGGTFINAQGQQIGRATLTQTPSGGVLVQVELRGLPPGEHAFHIHETGRCDPANGFQSAGGHFAPRRHQHGYLVQGGPHAGDMPNQFVGPDGVLRAQVLNPSVTLGEGEGTLFDADGSAIVVHANPDDYRSQPAGDAGGRIACAVIERQR